MKSIKISIDEQINKMRDDYILEYYSVFKKNMVNKTGGLYAK